MRLSLKISIRQDGGADREWASPVFDVADSVAWGRVLSPSAELLDVSSNADVVFQLVGDRRIEEDKSWSSIFKICGYGRGMPSLKYNDGGVFKELIPSPTGVRESSAIKFFKNVSRTTFIRLCIVVGKNEKGDDVYGQILEVPVTVVDSSGRGAMYLKMLDEILSTNPGLALPDDDKMAAPRLFDIVFPDSASGDTDINSELVQYEDLKRDLDCLVLGETPILRAIEMRPNTTQHRGERFMPLGKVRHITSRHTNVLRSRGIDDADAEAEKCVVIEDVFAESRDTVANRVIRTFLDDAMSEMNCLKNSFDEQIKIYSEAKSDKPRVVGPRYEQRLKDLRRISSELSENMRRVRRCVHASEMWSTLPSDINVLDSRVKIEDFVGTPEYLKAYWIIYRHYLRKHWLKTDEGDSFVSDCEIYDDPQEGGRQRSFDFMYESWFFVRLLKAFTRNGFMLKGAYQELLRNVNDVFMGLGVNESVEAEADDGEIRVGVTYGVTEEYSEKPLTPDFAIEFENKRTHRKHVIILDAKAVDKLNRSYIARRYEYLNMTWKQPQCNPNQSWLVFLGDVSEESGKVAGIEFSQKETGKNAGQRWDGRNGIVGVWTNTSRPQGNLRVNCKSIESYDVIEEFVAGQIATARRHI